MSNEQSADAPRSDANAEEVERPASVCSDDSLSDLLNELNETGHQEESSSLNGENEQQIDSTPPHGNSKLPDINSNTLLKREDEAKHSNADVTAEKCKIVGNPKETSESEISTTARCEPLSVDSEKECSDKIVIRQNSENDEDTSMDSKYKIDSDGGEYSEINQFLNSCEDAEARLLAKRAARAEAREIRMRDLERQQREQEEASDRQFDMSSTEPLLRRPLAAPPVVASGRYHMSSRRSSEDSLEDTGSLRDIRHELKEVEEKFRKAMIANAQLDNDKASQTYQIELLKDRLEELEEEHSQLKREHRDKSRDFEQLKRLATRLKEDLAAVQRDLEDRDRLIAEKGLVIVGEEIAAAAGETNGPSKIKRTLVSADNAHLLESAGEGSLDVRLGKFAKERLDLQEQISQLKLELEEERSRRRKHSGSATLSDPSFESDGDVADSQREALKQLADFKFRAQKAEQDVATLQATNARLESQVIRYKAAAEASEKSEESLKLEKRKLQREDTLSSSNSFDESGTDVEYSTSTDEGSRSAE